jgi:hypothetical protein
LTVLNRTFKILFRTTETENRMSEITIDRMANAVEKIKSKRSELSVAFKAEDKILEDKQDAITHEILNRFKEQGVDNVKTQYGTLKRVTSDRYWCNDWGPFLEYIKEHDALHLLQQRITITAMREWIADHPDDFPPALNCDRTYEVRLYKNRKEII